MTSRLSDEGGDLSSYRAVFCVYTRPNGADAVSLAPSHGLWYTKTR
jgi:hypothetical protein